MDAGISAQTSQPTETDRITFQVVAGLTVLVVGVVLGLNRHVIPGPAVPPAFAYRLPALNALLNGTCSLLLGASWLCIRRRAVAWHRRLNLTAFALSVAFLVSYVLYHYFVPETHFPHDNPLRPLYLAILASHILLAVVVLPLVLLSFRWGLTRQIAKHRQVVKWSMPLWLYVTVTGVVVYLMISPYYVFPA